MAITFRHDAAAVTPPSNSATRKYGQELVLQQRQQNQQQLMQAQQMKYQGYQAGLNRLFDATQQANQNQFQLERDRQQNEFQKERDRNTAQRQEQQQDAERQRAFTEDARKQSGRFIMDSIENGEYDDVTARELRQNLIEESEALGNPSLDATQRAEALSKLRARRAVLSANRMPKAPPPTPQQQFEQNIVTDPNTGMRYRQTAKGDYEPLEEPKSQRPKSFEEYYGENEDKFQKEFDSTLQSMRDSAADGTTVTEDQALEQMRKNYDFRQKALGRVGTPTPSPELSGPAAGPDGSLDPGIYRTVPGSDGSLDPGIYRTVPGSDGSLDPGIYKQPGQSRSILEGAGQQSPQMAQLPDVGQPPAPSGMDQYRAQMEGAGYRLVTPADGSKPYYLKDSSTTANQTAAMPDAGQPPAPPPQAPTSEPLAAMPDRGVPPSPVPGQQRVTVGGKPLTVSPGTLTPQETAARAEIMKLPREQRIASLMPYDPELKGKTLDQILDDPATKAGYDELTKQGLTTGNYREDMLTQLDEMLQHNVLKSAGQTPPDAYVGMNVNDVTDPKAKAELNKLPRPKSAQDMLAISGPYFIDPDGIIRGTRK